MTRLTLTTFLVASLAACTGEVEGTTPDPDNKPPEGSTAGDEETTYDHENNFDPWVIIDRLAKEGPARYTSRVHSCAKPRYRTLGNVLTSLGVNINNQTALSAGRLYQDGGPAMGEPNFANRIRENLAVTTSGASRMYDIWASAAPEIIAALPTLARCQVNGVGVQLFDGDTCRADGITCLIGTPALPAHITYCNTAIASATTPDIGKRIAVASMLAAAYTCE